MFQRVLRSWNRLVGRPASPAAVAEDRRVWVRYPCQLETTFRPAHEPAPDRLAARVQDISLGGINLVVDRRLDPGSLLSVDLPGADGRHPSTTLAYVVRVGPLEDGSWSAGCTFATELGDEDLEAFGARRVKPDGPDQRTWVRFPCEARATFQMVRAEEPRPEPAQVLNISPNGVGLLVGRAIDVGTLLSVDLRGTGDQAPLTIMASVARLTARDNDEWALGCNFIRELSDRELQALL